MLKKEKKTKNKYEPKNEFRWNNNTEHPNYVFARVGKKYKSMGLTHSEYTTIKGKRKNSITKKNMPLEFNPNPNDCQKAYIRHGIISDNIESYDKNEIKGFSFSQEDMAKVKSKRRNYIKRLKQHKKTSKHHR
ncbi:MAG: hypothetical protein K2I46_01155 [Clostridia bacterium]|nr:hypothetical protein [Clostridia bacterium]